MCQDMNEIKCSLYFVRLTESVFVDSNRELVMTDELQLNIANAFDNIDWVREVAEDMNGTIYQVTLKDMKK